ncbi:hypothetical protein MMC30_003920 [Trapelia coarctata]|nr:hypothetical protein [Trapelia coarctata]
MTSILLSLPRELRDQIYKLVLFSQIPRTIDLVPVLEPTEDGRHATSILRVNKQIHAEASRILYSNLTVVLPVKYLFQPYPMEERNSAYMVFRTPSTPLLTEAAASEVGVSRRVSHEFVPFPADQCSEGLIYESILRKVANIRYLMACYLDVDPETRTEIPDTSGCSLEDATEVITSLCADDPSDGKPVPKSFQLEIYSLNPQESPEDTAKMEALTLETVEQKGLEGPLRDLGKYRKVGVHFDVFHKTVDGIDEMHEGVTVLRNEWEVFEDVPLGTARPSFGSW